MTLVTVHFIRHGQAGSRADYDRLSDIGRQQCQRLGTWLAHQPFRFDRAWSGRLARHGETARMVAQACRENGAQFPEIEESACWDEFDLDSVYQGIGPQLARDDDEFRMQFAELQRQSIDPESHVHRKWAKCDTTIVRYWIDGRYSYNGESFKSFLQRVHSGRDLLTDSMTPTDSKRHVAVFTSATPAAVWSALALELDSRKILQLAGVTYNTAITVIRLYPDDVRLFQFNTVPHIDSPELLTHR
jgi:broad specificity phosphatase PhoE